ncbi:MMPL family transporter [Kribbella sp. NBC_01245]|uniref:MMPL family transporter n=1 Tax=Kribbella sp. NBC_01245 TaxID=2903578 RepID=UPI002E2A9207|nr:MMPL family transporter [Kribbella sp. NBC_01245]
MLHRLGTFAVRRAKLVLVLTAILLAAAAVAGFGAFGKLAGGGFDDPGAESTHARQALADRFGGQANLVVVIDAGRPVDQAVAQGKELTRRLSAEPDLQGVASYWTTGAAAMRSEDGTKALLVASIGGDFDDRTKVVERLVETYGGSHDGLNVAIGGEAGVNHDVNAQVGRDLLLAEAIAVPIILVLLILAFGSVVAALIPLAIGTIAIFGTFAELSVMGSLTDVSIYSVNLTTALGLGLAIDYALLMVSRYREELGKGSDVAAAVIRTVETSGRTIVFSAATVAVALAALLVFPLFFLRSFAYAGIGVILIAMAGALVVLPAILAVLGHRVNALRLPWAKGEPKTVAPFWGRLAALAMRRPGITAVPVVAGLLLLATPLLHVEFGTPDDRVLPTTATSRIAGDALRDDFRSDDTSAITLIGTSPVATADITSYAVRLSQLPDVVRVESAAGAFANGKPAGRSPADARLVADGIQRLAVVTNADTRSDTARDLVTAIRALPGPEFLVGGNTAQFMDSQHAIGSRLPLAGGLIALTTFLLLFLFTGSVLQPIRALLLNLIGLSATLGAMVLIFQDGHLSGLLGFTALPLDTSMLVLLFCIAFGLSMDYEVFVLSRIKEHHDSGMALVPSVTEGLARTGRIVSMAAILLAVSFFAFGTGSVSFIQLFGIGSGLAILIDATLIRGILVPAAMRLLGRRAWWSPTPLRRLHTHIGITEHGPRPSPEAAS